MRRVRAGHRGAAVRPVPVRLAGACVRVPVAAAHGAAVATLLALAHEPRGPHSRCALPCALTSAVRIESIPTIFTNTSLDFTTSAKYSANCTVHTGVQHRYCTSGGAISCLPLFNPLRTSQSGQNGAPRLRCDVFWAQLESMHNMNVMYCICPSSRCASLTSG